VDPNLQRKIVEAVDPRPEDFVLEVGPGKGALTRHLVGQCRHLSLVELDDQLVRTLEEVYGARDDVEIIHQSILEVPLSRIVDDPGSLKVVGNIPYNITAPILFHLLERPRPMEIVLMVQKEVADRIVAEPGTREYGALAVGVRSVATAERLFRVPPGAFRPVPRVESAVIRIVPFSPPTLSSRDEEALRILTRAAFGWRRKQFQKILRDHPSVGLPVKAVDALEAETGFDLRHRPERFSPEEFLVLARALLARGKLFESGPGKGPAAASP
jgi:16S rRNA (adenine1518-N6/adenine1519-N6)-dimethyltransferase